MPKYIPPVKGKQLKKSPTEPKVQFLPDVGASLMVRDLRDLKDDVVQTVNSELERVDVALENVEKKIDAKVKEVDKTLSDIEDTAVSLIKQLASVEVVKGEKGKDADEEKIIKNVMAKMPTKEQMLESIKPFLPTLDEKALTKKILAGIPASKASLKIIQENIEIDPMSVIEKIMALPDEARSKLQLGTSNISGLDQTMNAFRNQLGRGYLHGGGLSTVSHDTTLTGLGTPTSPLSVVGAPATSITGLISQGTNVTITGSGTIASPYVINSSGGGTPGGLNTQLQYNNAGVFGGISGATTNGTIVSLTNPLLGGATLTTSSVNGVTLVTGGTSSLYLSQDGTYSTPSGGGTVTSVSGTTNRITSTGGTTPIIDISAAYIGQTSITTLGTVTTGTLSTGAIISGVTMTLGSDASYDIYYRGATGVLTRLANGTTGQFLGANTSAAPTWQTPSGSGGITVGTTTITSGTTTRILYDNAGIVGEYTITGTGTVVAMQTSPVFTTPNIGVAIGTSLVASGVVTSDHFTSTSVVNQSFIAGGLTVGDTSRAPYPFTVVGTNNTTGVGDFGVMGDVQLGTTTNNTIGFQHGQADTAGTVQTTAGWDFIGKSHTIGAQSTSIAWATRNAGTFSEKMRLDSTGNFSIGSTTVTSLFNVGSAAQFQVTSAGHVLVEGVTSTGATGTGAFVFGTTPTISTPVINGISTGTGVSNAATVSTLVLRDTQGSAFAINFVDGFNTAATAGGSTTLTNTSNPIRVLTGTQTQTIILPVTATLTVGYQYQITNQSTGAVTVQSSGANNIIIMAAGTSALFTCVLASGTTAASWNVQYFADIVASGKSLSISNTLTLAGTDGTTMTFPSTSSTVLTTAQGTAVAAAAITSATTTINTSSATAPSSGQVLTATSSTTATWQTPAAGITWNTVSGTTQTAAVSNGYIANNAGLVTITLPTTAAVGSIIEVTGQGAGGWKLGQPASVLVNFGSITTTTGTGGSIASTNTFDSLRIVCIVANTTWNVLSAQGNLTIV